MKLKHKTLKIIKIKNKKYNNKEAQIKGILAIIKILSIKVQTIEVLVHLNHRMIF